MKGNKKIFFLVVIVSLFCISFSFDNDYVKVKANENIKVGIDISYHQGDVDWKAIKETGIDFVMLRIGYDYVMDSKFESYLMGAKSIGVDIGVYFYSYADSGEDAIN